MRKITSTDVNFVHELIRLAIVLCILAVAIGLPTVISILLIMNHH